MILKAATVIRWSLLCAAPRVGGMEISMKKEKRNYIDFIPQINIQWRTAEDGMVEVVMENKGFYHTIAQKLFKKPRYSYIKLDEYGSCVWNQIDGQKSIYEIGQILEKEHEKAAVQLYERLSAYFGILERNKFITFVNKEKK
jgi:hypothetical protein